jgi:hypothetical protein
VVEHQQQLQRRYQLPGAQEQAAMRCARPPVASREAPLCEQGGLMGTEAFLSHLQELPWYEGQVGAWLGGAGVLFATVRSFGCLRVNNGYLHIC